MKEIVKGELFPVMSDIVQLVITFELTISDGVPSTERELKISEIIWREDKLVPRLGLVRLSALELLDKLQLSYGLRMLEKFKDEDLYSTLMKMFALYPFNDIAHRYIVNIISFALDKKIGKKFFDAGAPPKRVNKFLDLELINPADKEEDNNAEGEEEVDE